MKKKVLIYALIALGWGLILGSYFISSWIYQEIVVGLFLLGALVGIGYLTFIVYAWFKEL